MPSNHLILCRPLLLPSIFPSIRVFSSESVLCIRWSKYWSFSFSISPSSEYSGRLSFRLDCFDLLAVHWTLQKHQFWALSFIVQLSHPYMTTGKTSTLLRLSFLLLCPITLEDIIASPILQMKKLRYRDVNIPGRLMYGRARICTKAVWFQSMYRQAHCSALQLTDRPVTLLLIYWGNWCANMSPGPSCRKEKPL